VEKKTQRREDNERVRAVEARRTEKGRGREREASHMLGEMEQGNETSERKMEGRIKGRATSVNREPRMMYNLKGKGYRTSITVTSNQS